MRFHVLQIKRRFTMAAIVTGAVVLTPACSSNNQSAFCRAIREPSRAFASPNPAERLKAFDTLVATASGDDQRDLRAIRPYLEILYGPVVPGLPKRSEQQALADINAALETTFPRLDYRIRRECRVPLEGEASVFGVLNTSSTSEQPAAERGTP